MEMNQHFFYFKLNMVACTESKHYNKGNKCIINVDTETSFNITTWKTGKECQKSFKMDLGIFEAYSLKLSSDDTALQPRKPYTS
jgi:hypothetical protein